MLNFALTVVAGFAFGYKVVEYGVGKIFAMVSIVIGSAGLNVCLRSFF